MVIPESYNWGHLLHSKTSNLPLVLTAKFTNVSDVSHGDEYKFNDFNFGNLTNSFIPSLFNCFPSPLVYSHSGNSSASRLGNHL